MATTVGNRQDGVDRRPISLYPVEYLLYEHPNGRNGNSRFTVQELREIAAKHQLSNETKKGSKHRIIEILQGVPLSSSTKRWNPRGPHWESLSAFPGGQTRARATEKPDG